MRSLSGVVAASLPILVMLTLAPVPSRSGRLLSGAEDWGAPPSPDYAQAPLPELPPYAGWYRFLGTESFALIEAVSDERMLVSYGENLISYNPASGAQIWNVPLKNGLVGRAGLLQAQAVIQDYDELIALDITCGKELWRTKEYELIGMAGDALWATRPRRGERSIESMDHRRGLQLLDGHSGKVRHSFETGVFIIETEGTVPRLDVYPIKADGVITLYRPDGTTLMLPSPRPAWTAGFAQNGAGLFVAEWPDPEYSEYEKMPSDAEREAALEKLRLDPTTGKPGADAILSYFELPATEPRWRQELTGDVYKNFFRVSADFSADCVVAWDIGGLIGAFNLVDGSPREFPALPGVEWRSPPSARDGTRLYYYGSSLWLPATTWVCVDLEAWKAFSFELALPCEPYPKFAAHGALFSFMLQGPGVYHASGRLLAVSFGPDGLPLVGNIDALLRH